MAKRKGSNLSRIVSREISRAAKRARPVTPHYTGLEKVLSRTKKPLVGPNPPPAFIEVPSKAPSLGRSGIGGRVVRKKGRG